MSTSKLDFRQRASLLASAEQKTFDLIVIGGGITGAGVARDAAMRGLSVALLEARDFASGTSSRSSKMVHGGLRYLAQGQVDLVREAASERLHLRNIAPHLAQLTPYVIPYKSLASLAKLKAGLTIFEKLGQVPKPERHYTWSLSDLKSQEPMLKPKGLAGGVVYHECLTDDARLTLANVRSAKEHGAHVFSYMQVTGFLKENGRAIGVTATGQLPEEETQITLKGRHIVNAAGPWVDKVMALENTGHENRLQLTKGLHFVVPYEKLPINNAIILTAPDKRSVFAVPRDGFTYFGTSDTFYSEPNYWPEIDANSMEYLFQICKSQFNVPNLQMSDIITVWSGIRPLIAQEGKAPSEISREEEIWTGPLGVTSIAGGKLSAYRCMAERIINDVQEKLGQNIVYPPTHTSPLPGGHTGIDQLDADPRLAKVSDTIEKSRLIRLYGDEVFDVVQDGGDLSAEIRRAVRYEGALRLEDFWTRRSARAWFSTDADQSTLKQAAEIMAEELNWSTHRQTLELANCQANQQDALAFLKQSEL